MGWLVSAIAVFMIGRAVFRVLSKVMKEALSQQQTDELDKTETEIFGTPNPTWKDIVRVGRKMGGKSDHVQSNTTSATSSKAPKLEWQNRKSVITGRRRQSKVKVRAGWFQ